MASIPDRSGAVLRVTSTSPAYHPLPSGAGTLAEVTGAVLSMLMPPTVAVAVFPALSAMDDPTA